jgi:hypothetical protein
MQQQFARHIKHSKGWIHSDLKVSMFQVDNRFIFAIVANKGSFRIYRNTVEENAS